MVDLRRREFITSVACSAAAWPIAARAQQQDRMRRIGVLMGWPESDPEAQSALAAFVQALQQLGWGGGRNVQIDTRWTTSTDAESMQRFAKELVALQPELILSHTTPTTAVLLQQTRTIPIIFTVVADPVGSGFTASLPRPGGNVTGFMITEGSLGGKWVELLKGSKRSRRALLGLCSCSTRPRQLMPNIISTRSRLPLRPLQWRRSRHLFATCLTLKPSLRRRLGSRIAA